MWRWIAAYEQGTEEEYIFVFPVTWKPLRISFCKVERISKVEIRINKLKYRNPKIKDLDSGESSGEKPAQDWSSFAESKRRSRLGLRRPSESGLRKPWLQNSLRPKNEEIMKKNGLFAAVLAAVLFVSCGGADKNGWYSDFDAAKKAAKAKNKNVLLLVNSDYDVPMTDVGIKALTSDSRFTDALKDSYVCVHFSFVDLQSFLAGPDLNATNSEQKAAEKRRALLQKQFGIADMYAVQETPAIVLVSKDGYYITSLSCDFLGSEPEGYVGLVNAEKTIVEEFQAKIRATETGSAKERIAAIDAIYESSTDNQRLALVDLSRKLVSLDKKNESGLVSKHLFAIANEEAFAKLNGVDYIGAIKIYSKYAEDKRILPVDAQALYFMAASVYARSGVDSIEPIISTLQKAVDVAPESDSVENIKAIMESLKSGQQQSEDAAAAASAENIENAEAGSAESADKAE